MGIFFPTRGNLFSHWWKIPSGLGAIEVRAGCVAVEAEQFCHACLLCRRDWVSAFAIAVVVALLSEDGLNEAAQSLYVPRVHVGVQVSHAVGHLYRFVCHESAAGIPLPCSGQHGVMFQ